MGTTHYECVGLATHQLLSEKVLSRLETLGACFTSNNDSHKPSQYIPANAQEWHEVCGIYGDKRCDFEVNFGCVDDNYDGNRGENDKNNEKNVIIICIIENNVITLQSQN